jgi:hypothetical protein
MLRTVLLAASLALPLAAIAADEKKPSSQQQRMASCNKDAAAKELKGEARKQFVSACLSGAKSETASQQMTQQQVHVARDDHEAQALRGVGARALGHPLAEIKSDVHVDRIAPRLGAADEGHAGAERLPGLSHFSRVLHLPGAATQNQHCSH